MSLADLIPDPLELDPAAVAAADLILALETMPIAHLQNRGLGYVTFDAKGVRICICTTSDTPLSYHPLIVEAAMAAMREDPPFPGSVCEVVCRTLELLVDQAKRMMGADYPAAFEDVATIGEAA